MSQILNAIEKRDILWGAKKVAGPQFLNYAKQYESAGQFSDAIDFYAKAESKEDLKRLSLELIAQGDVFFLLKISRLAPELVSDDGLKNASLNAEKYGKYRYAILGFEKLGLDSDLARVREIIKNDGDVLAAQEAETFVAANLEEIQSEESEE